MDYNRVVDFWPGEDEIAHLIDQQRHGGGSGFNLAVDIRRLDPTLPVETITMVGDDDNGRYLIDCAGQEGIRHDQMHVLPGHRTHATDAFVSQASHRRTHIYCSGAADLLSPDHFDFAATTGRILHLGLPGVLARLDSPWEGDANGWVTVLRRARQAGLRTNIELCSLDRQRLAELLMPCLPHLDTMIVNDTEIGALGGIDTIGSAGTDAAACERAARIVLERGAMDLVVVHWPARAIAVARDGTVTTRPSVALPPDIVAGANGAGDAFAAGMLYGLHEGWETERALALAHASAAVSMRAVTTTDSMESWQDCLRLAETWGWRN